VNVTYVSSCKVLRELKSVHNSAHENSGGKTILVDVVSFIAELLYLPDKFSKLVWPIQKV